MLDEKVLKQVEDLARLQFTQVETAILVDVSDEEMDEQDFLLAWARGSLKAQKKIRERLYETALSEEGGGGRETIRGQAQRELLRLGEKCNKLMD